MELVYLWIAKYKNIKKQGFNFSNEFECSYENNTLTINKKEDSIKNFFGNNIDITAIVGKNGSGKSSIVEFLFGVLFKFKENEVNKNCLIIYREGKKLLICKLNIEIDSLLIDKKDKDINDCLVEKNEFINQSYYLFFDISIIDFFMNNAGKKDYKENYALEPSRTVFDKSKTGKMESQMSSNHMNLYALYFFEEYNENRKLQNILKIPTFNNFRLEDVRNQDTDIVKSFLEKNFAKDIFKISNSSELDRLNEKRFDINERVNNCFLKSLDDKGNTMLDIFNIRIFKKIESDKEILFKDLSTGQQILIFYIGYIVYLLKKFSNKDSFFIFFDEIESTLHPSWQKQIIKFFIDSIDTLNLDNKQVNLYFLTHSPFLLSDLPKENVIFLDRDDRGNCKNVTKEMDIDTFGANIHTLLSDGFFMEDGLIGEFAKSKIEEIKSFYDEVKKSNDKTLKKVEYESKKDRFRKIQQIIGEKFLKVVVKNYLDELDITFYGKDGFIDKEIEKLQKLKKSLND